MIDEHQPQSIHDPEQFSGFRCQTIHTNNPKLRQPFHLLCCSNQEKKFRNGSLHWFWYSRINWNIVIQPKKKRGEPVQSKFYAILFVFTFARSSVLLCHCCTPVLVPVKWTKLALTTFSTFLFRRVIIMKWDIRSGLVAMLHSFFNQMLVLLLLCGRQNKWWICCGIGRFINFHRCK